MQHKKETCTSDYFTFDIWEMPLTLVQIVIILC